MASLAPGKCCLTGVKHEGTPKGSITTLGGIESYITGDKTSSKVVLYFPDVFGHKLINAQLLADSFAEAGYLTVIPDILDGDAFTLEMGEKLFEHFGKWLPNHSYEKVLPIVEKSYEAVKSEFNPKHIYSVGYCFGGRYTIALLGQQKLSAGAVAHPSLVQIEEIQALKGPLLISAAEQDVIYTPELRQKTETTLAEIGAEYHTTLSAGVSHGFAVRCDPKDKKAVEARDKAFSDDLWWFNTHE